MPSKAAAEKRAAEVSLELEGYYIVVMQGGIEASAFRRGKKVEETQTPQADLVEQGGGRAFYDFQKAAEENFLKEVAKTLKKTMGGHAEKIDVKGDRLPFLTYKGQNMSDMDADLTVSMSPMEDFQVKVSIWGDVVGHGNVARDKVMKSGVATPEIVAAMVGEILGARP